MDLRLLHELCSIPTAAFLEGRVIGWVEKFAAKRGIKVSRDGAGNMLLEVRGTGKGSRWVFQAHMDHPAFVVDRVVDAKTVECEFRGGVMSDCAHNTRIRFFDGEREVVGKAIEVEGKDGRLQRVTARVARAVAVGTIGMFDQGEGRVKGSRFYCRGCDDMAGAAAALAMLDRVAKRPMKSTVAVLLTRAEEVGFVGTIACVREGKLLRKRDRLITIECSAQQSYAQQGRGVIIRTGDATSIFNSSLTFFITKVAKELVKKDKAFKYQRWLMPGGSCEATVYDVFGYTAGATCLALGNYHNMDREKKCMAPEYIDVEDWKNEVKLFLEIARRGHEYEENHAGLRRYFMKAFVGQEKKLFASEMNSRRSTEKKSIHEETLRVTKKWREK